MIFPTAFSSLTSTLNYKEDHRGGREKKKKEKKKDTNQNGHVVQVCLDVVLVFSSYCGKHFLCDCAKVFQCIHKGGQPVNTWLEVFSGQT